LSRECIRSTRATTSSNLAWSWSITVGGDGAAGPGTFVVYCGTAVAGGREGVGAVRAEVFLSRPPSQESRTTTPIPTAHHLPEPPPEGFEGKSASFGSALGRGASCCRTGSGGGAGLGLGASCCRTGSEGGAGLGRGASCCRTGSGGGAGLGLGTSRSETIDSSPANPFFPL
jgi:hypothetical protein